MMGVMAIASQVERDDNDDCSFCTLTNYFKYWFVNLTYCNFREWNCHALKTFHICWMWAILYHYELIFCVVRMWIDSSGEGDNVLIMLLCLKTLSEIIKSTTASFSDDKSIVMFHVLIVHLRQFVFCLNNFKNIKLKMFAIKIWILKDGYESN